MQRARARDSGVAVGEPLRRLVESVAALQERVTGGEALDAVHQYVVDSAAALVGADVASLRFLDARDPAWMVAVAWRSCAGNGERWRRRSPVSEGVSGAVISTGAPVIVDDYQQAPSGSQLVPAGTRAVLGVPVSDRERVVGCLLVASNQPARRWTATERDLLCGYARHVGLALAVARAADAVDRAFTDPLTGLANRDHLLDRLEHALGRADRGAGDVSVLFLDLDGFKAINDSLGHSVGDRLLTAVAGRLMTCLRATDTCARVGGDEFAVLLSETADPAIVARRIIAALNTPYEIGEHQARVAVSVGIATGRDEAGTLLRNADIAMYDAKRRGGACYALFTPTARSPAASGPSPAPRTRRADADVAAEVRYQPIVELSSDRLAGFEAVIVGPDQRANVASARAVEPLVPIVPIVETSRRVLAQICADLAPEPHRAPVAVSLDVSLRELQEPGYADGIRRALRDAVAAPALIIELPAVAGLCEIPGLSSTLDALTELGVRLSLDHIGRGSTRLFELASLPLAIVKLSAPDFAADPRTSALLAGIANIAQRLGLATVALDIDCPEQRELMRAHGCELGQGRLLGEPVDAGRARALIDASMGEGSPARPAPRAPGPDRDRDVR